MHTEEQRDIHNFMLSEAENISVLGMGRTRANSVCFTKNWVNIGVFPNATPSCKFSKNSPEDQKCMGGAGKETKMHSDTFRESARKPRESIETLNMDSRSGHSDGFQAPFFPINLSPDLGYEAPRRRPLLWPVIHSMQSSPTPSPSSSTSRSLTPIGGESVSSSPSPPTVLESLESTSTGKKSYDTWTKEEQKILVQLWAENFERLERSDARKIWQKIWDEINDRLGCHKTAQKCMKKIKYLIDRYKEAKDWN